MLEEIFFVVIRGQPDLPPIIARLIGFIAAVICGYSGNAWYLNHAQKVLAEVQSQGLPEEESAALLARRDGTNIWAAPGFLLLFILVTFVGLFAIELMASNPE